MDAAVWMMRGYVEVKRGRTRVHGDRASISIDDEAVINVGFGGPEGERRVNFKVGGIGASRGRERPRCSIGNTTVVDGDVGVCGEADDCPFDGGAAGKVEVATLVQYLP